MDRLTKILKFALERWIQRGALHQMLFVAGLLLAISVGGGLAAWAVTDQFATPFDGIWWSFLRLTDPGYLGDDEGAALRVVSTIVTVLGYVLFMGSLIAIMSQWLNRTLRRLESGLEPISMKGHVVILGWTNRTPEITRQLLGAEGRLRRFLAEHRRRVLRIVVVADDVDAERRLKLRGLVGDAWREHQIYLRSGSSIEAVDLQRFDLGRAAAIIVPGDDFEFGDPERSDTRVVKTLLTLRPLLSGMPVDERPFVVAEVFDPRKVRVAEGALRGHVEVVGGDLVISRLIVQMIRSHRLSPVFFELLSHQSGCTVYVRKFPEFAGRHPLDLQGDKAIVIGAVRYDDDGEAVAELNPAADYELQSDDLLVLMARSYDDCVLSPAPMPQACSPGPAASVPAPRRLRVLMLGWSQEVGATLRELGSSGTETVDVTLVTRVSLADRQGVLAGVPLDGDRVRIHHLEQDYAVSGVLETIGLRQFDSVVFLSSSVMGTREEADARTILGHALLESVLEEQRGTDEDGDPEVIVELVDPGNWRMFAGSGDVMLMSPTIMSHLLTHVALRPELKSVFDQLFLAGGTEVGLRRPVDYGLAGRTVGFEEIRRAARGRGEIALGWLAGDGNGLDLCPSPDRTWTAGDGDAIVVLAEAASL